MRTQQHKQLTGKYTFASFIQFMFMGALLYWAAFYIYMGEDIFEKADKIEIYDLSILFVVLGAFGAGTLIIVTTLKAFFFDPLAGKYSFNKEGITFYTWIKVIHYPWEELVEVGFTIAIVEVTHPLPFIYFSKRKVSHENRGKLLQYRSFKQSKIHNMPIYVKDYALVQYNKKQFQQLLEVVPDHIKEQLIEEEKNVFKRDREKRV